MSDNARLHAILRENTPEGPLAMLLQGLIFRQEGQTVHIAFAHRHLREFYKLHQTAMENILRECLGEGIAIRYAGQKPKAPDIQDQNDQDFFLSFIPNPKNLPAIQAARDFCASPPALRTLVIYGPGESGKSLLLEIMARTLLGAGCPITRIHAADLHGQAVVGSLMADDCQDLAGNPSLQYELCRQIEMRPVAAAIGTKQLDGLTPRLVSRLNAALWVELYPPDLLTKIKFAEREARRLGLSLTQAQCMALARHSQKFSTLAGLLHKIAFYGKLNGQTFSVEQLEKMAAPANQPAAWQRICALVAQRMGVRQGELSGGSRKHEIVVARQAAMYLCRLHLGLSYPELGRLFGGRDHATVIHGIKKIQQMRKVDKVINALLTELENCGL